MLISAWSISENLEWGVDIYNFIGGAQSTCAWYQNVFIKKINT